MEPPGTAPGSDPVIPCAFIAIVAEADPSNIRSSRLGFKSSFQAAVLGLQSPDIG